MRMGIRAAPVGILRSRAMAGHESLGPLTGKDGGMARRLMVALICAAFFGGCAPPLGRSATTPAAPAAAPPPPAPAGNTFAPEPNHYFGSGGP